MFACLMQPDIQKAVDAGKLSARAGTALDALQPGGYCFHKSWGFGQIESFDFLVNQVTIHFRTKRNHTMQLDYAAESLQPISPEHILARKATDLEGVRKMARESPVELVRGILRDRGGKATQDQIAHDLAGDLFNETEFKRWWEATRKLLQKDGHFGLPAKKTDPVQLREEAVARADELLSAFFRARQLKEQLAALDGILKNIDEFTTSPAQLQPVVAAVEDAARKNQRLRTAEAVELVLARDELCAQAGGLQPTPGAITFSQLLREEERKLSEILDGLPAAKQKRVLSELPPAFGEQWVSKALGLLLRANFRIAGEMGRLLLDKGHEEELRRELDRAISEHSANSDLLAWICKERTGALRTLINPQLFGAAISAIEREGSNAAKKGGKLHDLLISDRELITDLLASAEEEVVRDAVRRLLRATVFDELDKRSLMARIIRFHPAMQSMLSGDTGEKTEALIVSWESLEKRKNEYEELITRKIPENTKEISLARSYGDLRENFEFKAAKEMQRVLMRRKAEMEQGLSAARGTNFENPDTTQVSIGTRVTLKNVEDGSIEAYSLLGAWDSDPENGIISYQAAIGQALLSHRAGDLLDLPTEHGVRKVEIVEINAYRDTQVPA